MKQLVYTAVIIVGLLIGLKANIFDVTVEKVQASPPTQFCFQPKANFNLELDLETGKALVESNYKVTSTNVKVNHPTKVIEKIKVVEKPVIKEVKETKLVKVAVPMKLEIGNLHPGKPNLPERFD